MSASVDILHPDRPKRIVIVASNPAVSEQTGERKTWTGFANSEERFVDDFVGRRVQRFWIEHEARKLENTNFIVSGRFKPHAVRDGDLITGQQQHSGRAAARLMIEALGT